MDELLTYASIFYLYYVSLGVVFFFTCKGGLATVARGFFPFEAGPPLPDELKELELGFREKLKLRREIHDSNYGRDGGWYVELDGRRLALLTEPRYVEMFWVSYHLLALGDTPEERALVRREEFWLNDALRFRSARFDLLVDHAFAALTPFVSPGRVSMRGLYICIPRPALYEKILYAALRRLPV